MGVILDGHASGKGDASRGARFNSVVRYHYTHNGECLIIIVSEDGMINLLPNLRRRVAKESVEAAVQLLEDTITRDPEYEVFFRHWRHLESLAFYLTAAQCDRVNAARTALEDRAQPRPNDAQDGRDGRMGRITHVGWVPLAPNPEMNSSYFLDSE